MAGEQCHEHIVLIGFMGSGKSTVARRLKKLTGLPIIDVDARIEQMQGKTISAIFDEVGEEGFRQIETATLAGIVNEPRSIVSCGGGVVSTPANLPVLADLGTVVYLQVPLEEAIERISDPSTRPMLSGPTPVEDIYAERLPLYEEAADVTVNTSGKSVGKVAAFVLQAVQEHDNCLRGNCHAEKGSEALL